MSRYTFRKVSVGIVWDGGEERGFRGLGDGEKIVISRFQRSWWLQRLLKHCGCERKKKKYQKYVTFSQ